MSKVLIAVDDSDHSRGAADWYTRDMYKEGDDVILLHIQNFPFYPTAPTVRSEILEEMFVEAKKKGEDVLRAFVRRLAEAKITARTVGEFNHRPGEEVVRYAGEHGAAYIVMGTRGLGSLRRTVLGSVSDYVIHHAHCPVCIYREPHAHAH